ncbi:MAG: hypothetical protein D6814_11235, partial [Calditrichaeota bacterium]
MRHPGLIFCITLLGLGMHANGFSQSTQAIKENDLIPVPQDFRPIENAAFVLQAPLKIVPESSTVDPHATAVTELVAALDKFKSLKLRVTPARKIPTKAIFLAQSTAPAAKKWLQQNGLAFTAQMQAEGYVLQISKQGVVVIGGSSRGLFYGVMTLIQVIEQAKQPRLPGMQVRDWPALRFRGVSDDISRGQVSTLAHFKKIVRFLAKYKMNTYMLYLEDMFRFKKYPQIGQGRGALTAEETKELQAFAKNYFVEIIPIFQTLGHYENILNQPEFMHLAEFPGAASLSPAKPAVYDFLQDLIDEIAPVFESPYFHMGADESWDVGKGASRALVERYDIATVHARHYQKVAAMLRKHHKKVLMYGDIILQHPTILN